MAVSMNAPTFRVGEEIYSDVCMGKIRFARVYDGNWFYVIAEILSPHEYKLVEIQDIDVIAVWRNGKWTGK